MASASAPTKVAKNLPGTGSSPNGRSISKLPARQKVERDNRIIELRLQGLSWPKIAREVGAAERTCRKAFADWAHGNLRREELPDPLPWLLQELAKLDAKYEQLGEIAYDSPEPTTKLAAIGRQLDVMKRSHELRVAAKLLPEDLGVLPLLLQQRTAMKVIIDVFHQYRVPVEAVEEMQALLDAVGSNGSQRDD